VFHGSGDRCVPTVRESTMKTVGKPDAGNPHARFDERGWETGRRSSSAPAPNLDSTAGVLLCNHKIFTARAASNATVTSEISDCTIIITLAHRDSTGTSVGENAVLVLNARNR
jgi:hypothetical protein